MSVLQELLSTLAGLCALLFCWGLVALFFTGMFAIGFGGSRELFQVSAYITAAAGVLAWVLTELRDRIESR